MYMNTRNTSASDIALLLVTVTAVSGLFAAAPAHADYGAPPVYNSIDTVCSGRNDPNCIVKETQAAIIQAAPYQYPGQNNWNNNYYNQSYNYPTNNYPTYNNLSP